MKRNLFHLISLVQASKRNLSDASIRPTGQSELRELKAGTVTPGSDFFTGHQGLYRLTLITGDWVKSEANKASPHKIRDKGWSGRWNRTCLYMLPNIRHISVVKGAIYRALSLFGISWVQSREISLYGWRNRPHDKYLRAMYSRLKHARVKRDLFEGNLCPDGAFEKIGRKSAPNAKYWNLAYFLMTHSLVFQITHLNKVLGNKVGWPTRVSLQALLGIMKEVRSKLSAGNWMEAQVRRVWIDDSKRPLGVPTLPDRVIGSMVANLLEYFLWNTIKYNHAYQAGKGTGTAWRTILTRGIYYPWIWEFDLDGCFNKISHKALVAILRSMDLPSWLWISLVRIQKKAPELDARKTIRTNYGTRHLVEDKGATKKFYYFDGVADRGVAQGHSLSPLLAVIVIEHAIRSWLTKIRETGEVWFILMYADDGLVFTLQEPAWVPLGKFLAKWGMYISIPKSGFVRENWVWVKSLKFLGLLYNPFKEKLQAATRKGAKAILESSKTLVYEGEKLLRTEDGIFIREEYGMKLGEYVRRDYLRAADYAFEFVICLLMVYLHKYTAWPGTIYLLLKGILPWWGVPFIMGSWEFGHPWQIVSTLTVLWAAGQLPRLSLVEETHFTQQITWRLVVRSGLLNQFMARLYNNSIADKIVPQDFKVKPVPHSLIWHLRNTGIPLGEGFLAFMEAQGLRFWNWVEPGTKWVVKGWSGETLSERIETDMEQPITVFNASTVATHLLIAMLARERRDVRKSLGPSTYGLYRRLLDKFNLNGWWWAPPPAPGVNPAMGFKQAGSVSNPSRYFVPNINAPTPPLRPRKANPIYKPQGTIKLLSQCDWGYLLTDSYYSTVQSTRHRFYQMWPWHMASAPIQTGRVYRTYRIHVMPDGSAHGWLPVIRRKSSNGVQPMAENHKFPIVVHMGGKVHYEPKGRTLFCNKLKRGFRKG